MEYIKGTKSQCEAYNKKVINGEGYAGKTIKWAETVQLEGDYYIPLHPKYKTDLPTVKELPPPKNSNQNFLSSTPKYIENIYTPAEAK